MRKARRAAVWMAVGSFVALAALLTVPASRAQQIAVDVELVLAIDCSYSVDAREFELQMTGLAAAFRHPAVVAAIQAGDRGAIGVAVVQWSGAATQSTVVPWTLITDAASGAALAARIEAAPRMTREGATSISAMVAYGIRSIESNRLAGARRVIDISADGFNNTGYRIRTVATLAALSGVTVNGLAILNEVPMLGIYFEKHVIAGAGAFAMEANDYHHYAVAILRKLIREIGNPAVT